MNTSSSVDALLASSLQYGVVSRSYPLVGNVLRGYLSSSGRGQGVGNPNVEFSPDATACAIASDGGTAKIAWGFRSGNVTISIAAKAMDKIGPVPKIQQCRVDEKHNTNVYCIAWDASGTIVFSGSNDGVVKVWDPKTARCLWTSQPAVQSTGDPNSVQSLGGSWKHGFLVSTFQNGDLATWMWTPAEEVAPLTMTSERVISCPISIIEPFPVLSMHIDTSSSAVLIAYQFHKGFFRLNITDGTLVTFSSDHVTSTVFPVFATPQGDRGFILTGDTLGSISITPWGNVPSDSVRTFEAHEDGAAVNCIHWDGITLVSGSASHGVYVFDALSLLPLKTFAMGRNGVKAIMVSKSRDTLFASVNDHVFAWKAGPVSRRGPRVIHTKKQASQAKSKAYGTSCSHSFARVYD
jgi:WD40 repeat protein